MFKFVTPPNAALFSGILGLAMILSGREIGGAILISTALLAFTYLQSDPTAKARESRIDFFFDRVDYLRASVRGYFRKRDGAELDDINLDIADDMQQRQINRYRD